MDARTDTKHHLFSAVIHGKSSEKIVVPCPGYWKDIKKSLIKTKEWLKTKQPGQIAPAVPNYLTIL
jgi:hypothetical protein